MQAENGTKLQINIFFANVFNIALNIELFAMRIITNSIEKICFNSHTQWIFVVETHTVHNISNSHLFPSIFGHLPLVIDVTLVAKHHLLHIS